MPTELTAPSQPICADDKPQSALSAASTNESSPTSMASNIQPSPESMSRRLREMGLTVRAVAAIFMAISENDDESGAV